MSGVYCKHRISWNSMLMSASS